jgi:1-acyl-sn-glycerol-3-phosphate acyltransferase
MTRTARAATVALYVALFWGALPVLLWWLARFGEHALRWRGRTHAVGWPIALTGAALILGAIATLRREGGGLPVSAVPPPALARGAPYSHMRHPLYLGFNVMLFGAGLAAGSPVLAWVVAPLFLPVWIGYALLEERALVRRFGDRYRHYRTCVGLLPALPGLEITRFVGRLYPLTIEGRGLIPKKGPAILVANHSCYLDPVFVGCATRRRVHFLATAEMYRSRLGRAYAAQRGLVPVRRYRPDPAACRETLRLLSDGALVCVFVEGERGVLGQYQGADPSVSRFLHRLPYPVIPVGVSGSYDCGPRWADSLRRRPVRVRVGPPIVWGDADPTFVLDRALLTLQDANPQAVHLEGLPRERIGRVLWRCPACLDEPGWSASALCCARCGERYEATPEGLFRERQGRLLHLADLGHRIEAGVEEGPLSVRAEGWREESWSGPIRPLAPLGAGVLEVSRVGLRFGSMELSLDALRSVSTERADVLQVATDSEMFQFRLIEGSVFRSRRALDRWRLSTPRRRRQSAGHSVLVGA